MFIIFINFCLYYSINRVVCQQPTIFCMKWSENGYFMVFLALFEFFLNRLIHSYNLYFKLTWLIWRNGQGWVMGLVAPVAISP